MAAAVIAKGSSAWGRSANGKAAMDAKSAVDVKSAGQPSAAGDGVDGGAKPAGAAAPLTVTNTLACIYYPTGKCLKGSDCTFLHLLQNKALPIANVACKYHLRGQCQKGAECTYLHIVPTRARLPERKIRTNRKAPAIHKSPILLQEDCDECGGTGDYFNGYKTEEGACSTCDGSGKRHKTVTLSASKPQWATPTQPF